MVQGKQGGAQPGLSGPGEVAGDRSLGYLDEGPNGPNSQAGGHHCPPAAEAGGQEHTGNGESCGSPGDSVQTRGKDAHHRICRQDRTQQSCLSIPRQESKLPKAPAPRDLWGP